MAQINQTLVVDDATLRLTGDHETVEALLQKVAPGEYHFSKSKQEFIAVSDMATPYLVNAINKDIREQIEAILKGLRGGYDEELAHLYRSIADVAGGLLSGSTHVLIEEFAERENEGRLDPVEEANTNEFGVVYTSDNKGSLRVAGEYGDWQAVWRG